jgi:alcohol dehydrogenase class IV
MLTQPNIRYLTDIYFDFGAVSVLPTLLSKYNISRPLIITDKGIINAGIIDRLPIDTSILFDNVETNPTEAMALGALEIYSDKKCNGIIAIGGGSPIDLAKCVGILIYHELPLDQYAIISGGSSRITHNIPPIIAIPTTAGSGSEVGRAALLTVKQGKKLGFLSDHLIPSATICDPELTLGMPPQLTAATGMDALSHCVETYCSSRFNPVADAIALNGLERGYHNIVTATKSGNRQARAEMMMCSLEGGLAFQKGLGAVHSLSHPLGGLTEKRLHHGTLNAIFLPHVLRFNFDYCKDKIQGIAKKMDINNASEVADEFAKLIQELGLPSRLRDLGISKDELEPLAKKAKEDHCTATNPRPLEIEDCRDLYLAAW